MAQNHPQTNDRYVILSGLLPALGTAKSIYLPCPVNGKVKAMDLGVNTAVDADNVVKAQINAVDITGASITLTTSHTAGTVKCSNATAANSIKRGEAVEIETDGGGGAGEVQVSVLVEMD